MISINITKKYKKTLVFKVSDITIDENKISLLIGKNGSGKTTLLKCISNLEDYEGNINFGDDNKPRNLMIIWDDTPFYRNLNGYDNLLILSGKKLQEECYLSDKILRKKVGRYSYGQKKILSVILLEMCDPEIIIMDEITNGLDYDFTKILKNKLLQWKKSKTILLTGHDYDFYEDLTDDLFVINDKKIEKIDFNSSERKLGEIHDKIFS